MCKNHLFFHPCHCCLWFFLTWCDELKTLLSTSSFSHTCVFPRAYGSKRILRCKYFIHALSLQIKRVLREDHETYADLHHSTLTGQDRFQVLFFTIYLNDYADNISVVSLCGGSSMVCPCVDWIKKPCMSLNILILIFLNSPDMLPFSGDEIDVGFRLLRWFWEKTFSWRTCRISTNRSW